MELMNNLNFSDKRFVTSLSKVSAEIDPNAHDYFDRVFLTEKVIVLPDLRQKTRSPRTHTVVSKSSDSKRKFDSIYSVQKADSILKLAIVFQTSAHLIAEVNNLPSSEYSIQEGQKLLVPSAFDSSKHPEIKVQKVEDMLSYFESLEVGIAQESETQVRNFSLADMEGMI